MIGHFWLLFVASVGISFFADVRLVSGDIGSCSGIYSDIGYGCDVYLLDLSNGIGGNLGNLIYYANDTANTIITSSVDVEDSCYSISNLFDGEIYSDNCTTYWQADNWGTEDEYYTITFDFSGGLLSSGYIMVIMYHILVLHHV